MSLDNPLLFFLCSLGVFNGFLVSVYFLFFNKHKRVQNYWFGLLVLFLSVRIGKSVYRIFIPKDEVNLLVMQIGLSACFLIGISLFYYIKTSLENSKIISKSSKIYFTVLFIIIILVGILKPYESNNEFWGFFFKIIYTVWGIYLLASAYLLKDIFINKFLKSKKQTTSQYWLMAVFIANILIYVAYIIGYYKFYVIGTITFSVVFYGLLIFFLSKKNRDSIFQDIPQKYASKKINKKEANRLLKSLNLIMIEKEFYKNANIKLKDISKELGVSSHQLSQLLNDNLGKSFALFINEYRVEEAKRIIISNHQFTLEAIGFEAGFSSKSTFYAAFKKIVGKTPAAYKKDYN
ncbi:MAG: helix-turn-helix domain-containing protein [Flavobacteriaceae bacterium]